MSRLLFAALLLAGLSVPGLVRESFAGAKARIEIALTVDDLPGMGGLPAGRSRLGIARDMIAALRTSGVAAYGFANGLQLAADPPQTEVLRQWADAGFPVGNHTFSHPDLGAVDAPGYIANIARMDALLAALDLSGDSLSERRVFRYPYLAEGNTMAKRDAVRKYLFEHGYRIAEVTADYHDWAWNDAYTRCLARHDQAALRGLETRAQAAAIRHLEDSVRLARVLFGRDIRQILLTHMGAFEAAEIGAIIARYRAAGADFIPLSRALEDPVYNLNPNFAYAGKNLTFLGQVAASRHLRPATIGDEARELMEIGAICR